MKHKLSVSERIIAGDLLPQKFANIFEVRVKKDLAEKLGFDAEEQAEARIVAELDSEGNPTGRIKHSVTHFVEIEFAEKEVEMLKNGLLKLEKEEALEEKHESLYAKFIENKTE